MRVGLARLARNFGLAGGRVDYTRNQGPIGNSLSFEMTISIFNGSQNK
jgi:hypothetical protein